MSSLIRTFSEAKRLQIGQPIFLLGETIFTLWDKKEKVFISDVSIPVPYKSYEKRVTVYSQSLSRSKEGLEENPKYPVGGESLLVPAAVIGQTKNWMDESKPLYQVRVNGTGTHYYSDIFIRADNVVLVKGVDYGPLDKEGIVVPWPEVLQSK